MLKKSGALLLVLLYVVTASGFALNFSYCCNHLTSVKVNTPPVKTCSMTMSGKNKCCKNKHIEIKVKDAHQVQSAPPAAKSFIFELPRLSFISNILPLRLIALTGNHANAPPDKPLTSVNTIVKNRAIRI